MTEHECPNGHTDIKELYVSSVSIGGIHLTFNNQTIADTTGKLLQTIYYRCNVCGKRFKVAVDKPLPPIETKEGGAR